MRKIKKDRFDQLEKISKKIAATEYMKKMSGSVSLYFKNIEKIVFRKTLLMTKQTELFEYVPKDEEQNNYSTSSINIFTHQE